MWPYISHLLAKAQLQLPPAQRAAFPVPLGPPVLCNAPVSTAEPLMFAPCGVSLSPWTFSRGHRLSPAPRTELAHTRAHKPFWNGQPLRSPFYRAPSRPCCLCQVSLSNRKLSWLQLPSQGAAALDCPSPLSDGDFLNPAQGSENRKSVLHGKQPKLATRSSSLPGQEQRDGICPQKLRAVV